MLRVPRVSLAVALTLALGVGVAADPGRAAAQTHSHHSAHSAHKHKRKHKPAKPPRPVTIAPGARVTYTNVKIGRGHVVRSSVLRFDVRNPRVRLDATVPNNAVGAGRQTMTYQAAARRAVAGINADFFDVGTRTGEPKGGLIINGALLKSPRPDWDANFYVRGGRARIGRVAFSAKVTRAARPDVVTTDTSYPATPPVTTAGAPATSRTVTSVNDVRSLTSDKIILITNAMAAPRFPRSCRVVSGTAKAGHGVVTAIRPAVRSVARVPANGFALVACGTDPRAAWLRDKIIVGDELDIATTFAGGTPSTLVSGGRVLVSRGRAFADNDGKRITGRNPESFGCVSASGTTVLLGTIDGRREGSSGVTLTELRAYLLRLRCYTGIVFDGGGSSTLVGAAPGTVRVRVLNRPSDRTGARRVTTGLVLYRR